MNADEVEQLAGVYAGYLDRIAETTLAHCGGTELLLRTPPPSGDEIRHAEAALGAPLPEEVLAPLPCNRVALLLRPQDSYSRRTDLGARADGR